MPPRLRNGVAAAALTLGCATHGNPIFPWQYYVPLRTSRPVRAIAADLSKELPRLQESGADLFARLTTADSYEKTIARMTFFGDGFHRSGESGCYEALLDLKEKVHPAHPSLTKKQRRTRTRLKELRRERRRSGTDPRKGNGRVRLCGSGEDAFTFKIMLHDKVFVHGDGLRLAVTADEANELLYVQFDGASFRRTRSRRKRYEPAPPLSGAILGRIKTEDEPPADPGWWDGLTRSEWGRK